MSFFQKIIAFFQAIWLFIVGLFGGASTPNPPKPTDPVTPAVVISYAFSDATVKIQQTKDAGAAKSYTMFTAKNESEYCQVSFKASENINGAKVTLTEFKNANGDRIDTVFCEEYYVNTKDSNVCPDALIPVSVGQPYTFQMTAQKNHPFFIGIKTSKNTVPGDYTAKLTLDYGGTETLQAEVAAHVWNFTLPDTPAMDTAMGLGRGNIAKAHHVAADSAKGKALYATYYEFLLAHKISAFEMPVDILSDEADAYMSDPRCTSFGVPYSEDDDELRSYAAKVESNPVWSEKSFLYPVDEPASKEAYEEYDRVCTRLASVYPGYNMVTPFYVNTGEIDGEIKHAIDLQDGKSNIMCPETPLFDEAGFAARAYERQANGDKLWWYVCAGPGPNSGYCNLFTQQEGIRHRLLFWQQKQMNVTGFLYWSTTYWNEVGGDPWSSAVTTPWTNADTFGDGSLLYDGYHLGLDTPVSSLRLEAVTNGIEDYEYLTLAEQLLGKDYVDQTIARLSTDLKHYTLSDALFAQVRTELGNAIEAATD